MNVQGDFNSEINDVESQLLQQFSCMSTSSKDDLIKEFQRLLAPNQLNGEGCAFFLDMNNWNLEKAICSYFDYDAHKLMATRSLPSMTFISDVTIGDGEEVPPSTHFVKTWRILNSGNQRWPPGCILRFVAGDQMGTCERIIVDALEIGQTVDLSVSMTSPQNPGIYQGQWRMSLATGQFFGEVIWVIITVAEGGLLSLTQQMNSFNVLGSSKPSEPVENPFSPNVRSVVQRLKESEMQIDEENKRN